jgi:ketosteroid isomerase-like protein
LTGYGERVHTSREDDRKSDLFQLTQQGEYQMKIPGLFCTVAALACFCLAPAAYADSVRAGIEAANAQFSAAAARGDGAALAALYSTDGQVMPAGSAPIRGTEAIQKFWQGALDSGVATVGLKTIDVFGRGPTATEVGEYELHDKAGAVLDHGKYIVVWRHIDGAWKLLRDMFSTNVPPAKK